MIKEETINILITSRNKNFYKKYNAEVNKVYLIDIDDVNKNSKERITAICDVCGEERNISIQKYWKNYNNYNIYTCRKCSGIKNEKTNLKKYGVKYPMQNTIIKGKQEQTNLEKYGVKNVFEIDTIKEKIKETNLEKYGVEYPMQNNKLLEKQEKTNLERYGVKRPAQNKDIAKKISEKTFLMYEKYNDIFHKEQIIDKKYNNLEIFCKKCENIFTLNEKTFYTRLNNNDEICTICNPLNKQISGKEIQLLDFIKTLYYGEIIQSERKILDGKEIDIYLPELKLGFEFNGSYWHSLKKPGYHFFKSRKALEKNIRLYHIWENDWDNNLDVVKNFIKTKIDNESVY